MSIEFILGVVTGSFIGWLGMRVLPGYVKKWERRQLRKTTKLTAKHLEALERLANGKW